MPSAWAGGLRRHRWGRSGPKSADRERRIKKGDYFFLPVAVCQVTLATDSSLEVTECLPPESRVAPPRKLLKERRTQFTETNTLNPKIIPPMSNNMPAVVNFAAEPESVEIREISVPEIGDNDVLLAVQAVGVCGSDIHQMKGKQSWKVNYPVVLGHEFGGIIAKKGKNVRGFEEGDRVVSETAAVVDMSSPYARQGLYNLDPNRRGYGAGVDGAMTKFAKVPDRILHHIPESLPAL